MGKAPAFQFYVRDWLSDPQLRMATPSTRGIWMDCLCFMWESPTRGTIQVPLDAFPRMVGADNGDVERFFDEAKRLDFASVTVHNKNVTITNRRMAREWKEKENNRLRQKRFRNKTKSNTKVTPPSSSSTSSSKLLGRKKTPPDPRLQDLFRFWDEQYQVKYGRKYAFNGKKDGTLLKSALSVMDADAIRERIKLFFSTSDEFVLKAGHTIGVFHGTINKPLQSPLRSPQKTETDTRDLEERRGMAENPDYMRLPDGLLNEIGKKS